MLESLEVKKAYRNARQELANALYREDAATRAIARIMKERDEARSALASIQATIGGSSAPSAAAGATTTGGGGDVEMADDSSSSRPDSALPADVDKILIDTNATLSATRRKRKPAPGYVTATEVRTFTQVSTVPSLHATKPQGITALDLSADGNLALTGGADKTVQVYDFKSEKTLATLKGHTKAVNHVAFAHQQDSTSGAPPRFAISGSADKTVKVWKSSSDEGSYALAGSMPTGTTAKNGGEVVGLSIHPSNKFVSAASSHGAWSLYDVEQASVVKTYEPLAGGGDAAAGPDWEYTAFDGHPDGVLHACGTKNGIIRVWDARDSSALAATLDEKFASDGSVASLSFSENGYYLAASGGAGGADIKVIDLRKLSTLKSWQLASAGGKSAAATSTTVRFDPSAQFLTVVGTDCRVYANKSFEELLAFEENAGHLTGARWGAGGSRLVVAGMDRTLRVLGQAPSSQ